MKCVICNAFKEETSRDFEVGQKAYLCFNEPEEVEIVKVPYYCKETASLRMEIKGKDGLVFDPVPSLVYHSKAEYYDELIEKLTKKLKKAKTNLKKEVLK